MKTRTLLGLGGAGLVVAGLVSGYFLIFQRSSRSLPPPDPRLLYSGPFRNIHPHAAYAPEERCAACHATIAASFARHPMGRSLEPAATGPRPPEDAAHHNPFDALGSRFLVERVGEAMKQRRIRPGPDGHPAAELDWNVGYVLGSGTRGHSYLASRDGYVFQTPFSWYTQANRWDLAPGFGPPLLTGRPVGPDCLYCHANRAVDVPGSLNHYGTPVFEGHAIGCQRCHGPGTLHVAGQELAEKGAGDFDTTIVNPARLEPALRDAICEQCHLAAAGRVLHRGRGLYDFRPGLPLDAFWSVYVHAPGADAGQKAVSQVEQMHESRCYQRSEGPGRLNCATCHDPHAAIAPEQRVSFYRGRCLQCHVQESEHARGATMKGCSLPRAERLQRKKDDSCIDCHMPRLASNDIPHTAAFDHRILRDPKAAASRPERPAATPELPMVSYFRQGKELTAEDERDRAIALVRLAVQGDGTSARALPRVVPALEAAVRRDPEDLQAGEALGQAFQVQNRNAEALAAYEGVLARSPEREEALAGAAATAEALEQTNRAIGYWHRAVAVNPWMPESRRRLALLLVKREAWPEAEPECAAWVRLDPFSTEGRTAHVACLAGVGKKAEARAEFARLEALEPANLQELRIRFEKRLR